MKRRSGRLFFTLLILLRVFPAASAQDGGPDWAFRDIIPGGHRGPVRALAHDGNRIISAGDDGFLEIWNTQTGAAEERFQASPYRIGSLVQRPEKPEVCLIESDGLGLYRISVWNYRTRAKLFTLRFRDPVRYVNYSAGGNFIIAARSGSTGLVFIDAETGELLQSPELTGMVNFAATGRSERNMIVYLSWGNLSYWDLRTGTETGSIEVPSGLNSPVIFGNNRFFAGLGSGGLTVVDAVSGEVLGTNAAIGPDSLLFNGGDRDFYCLARAKPGAEAPGAELYRFELGGNRRLTVRERRPLAEAPVSALAIPEGVALGGGDGGVRLAGPGGVRELTVKNQRPVVEAAVSGSSLAFMAGGDWLGVLPLDYFRLEARDSLELEKAGGYDRLLAFPGPEGDGFVLWQAGPLPPLVRPGDGSAFALQSLPVRPLRSAAAFDGKLLFLDSAGRISIVAVDPVNKKDRLDFSFSSVGSLDAAFVSRDAVILGRSGVSGNSPFLTINLVTGETVPLPYPASAGARVYRGPSGALYAAGVDQEAGGPRTSIVRLDAADPLRPVRLAEYQGEDTLFSLAEASGVLASNLGGEGAALFSPGGMLNFERSPGLPRRLVEGGRFFIVIDGDGNICWHDPQSGRLLALFRLYDGEWILLRDRGEALWGTAAGP